MPGIIAYVLGMVAMFLSGLAFIKGHRKRIVISLLAAFVALMSLGVWILLDKESSITAFEDEIISHFEDGYGYQLTSENAEQIRFAEGSDAVMHVMTEEGNVREVLFRGVDGVVVPFANDTNGEWARAAAGGN